MDPSIWGKHGWKFIHFVAQGYPDKPSQEQKLQYKNFFNSIQYVLPCSFCRDHYTQNLINNPRVLLTLIFFLLSFLLF